MSSLKLTIQEIELLASILQRAGVNQVEAAWVNGMLSKLRRIAAEQHADTEPETNVIRKT